MVLSSIQVCMDSPNWPAQERDLKAVNNMMECSGRLVEQRVLKPQPEQALKCPRCDSTNTKFCYYNNYSLTQPRYFCKACRRYWTRGGALRNVPVGGGCRKNKRSKRTGDQTVINSHNHNDQMPAAAAAASTSQLELPKCTPLDHHPANISGVPSSMYYGNDINLAFSRLGDQPNYSNSSEYMGFTTCGGQSALNSISPISSLSTLSALNSLHSLKSSAGFCALDISRSLRRSSGHEALGVGDLNSFINEPAYPQIITEAPGIHSFPSFTMSMDHGLNNMEWRIQQQPKMESSALESEGQIMMVPLGDQTLENSRDEKSKVLKGSGELEKGLSSEWQEPPESIFGPAKDSIYWNGGSWTYLSNYGSSSVSPLI